ncbi:MAG: hypothetical protein JW904_08640 [Spirochaetales bacterium]|nr:hypothetical protein [Spirochaetales bacterium]
MELQKKKYSSLLVVFVLAVIALFFFTPLLINGIVSLMEVRLDDISFTGIQNYIDLSQSPHYWTAFGNTIKFFSWLKVFMMSLVILSGVYILLNLKKTGRAVFLAISGIFLIVSSPLLNAAFYTMFYSPQTGLVNAMLEAAGQKPVYFLADPEYAPEIIGNADFLSTLGLLLPAAFIIYTAIARGSAALSTAGTVSLKQLVKDSWRLICVFTIAIIGFSYANYEAIFNLSSPLTFEVTDILQTLAFRSGLQEMRYGFSAAALTPVFFVLITCGAGLWLFLEGTGREFSISIFKKNPSSVVSPESRKSPAGITLLIAAIIITTVGIILLFVRHTLPFITSVFSLDRLGDVLKAGGFMERLFSSLLVTASGTSQMLIPAALSLLCGYAIGYLRPKSEKIILFIISLFIFFSPAVSFLFNFIMIRSLGIINTVQGITLPYFVSALGIFVSVYFFRGIRKDHDLLMASGSALSFSKIQKKTLFAIGAFGVLLYSLSSINWLNATLWPIVAQSNPQFFNINVLARIIFMEGDIYGMEGMGITGGTKGLMVNLILLQYIVPVALFVISSLTLLSRISIISRKKTAGKTAEPYSFAAEELEPIKADSGSQKKDALSPAQCKVLPAWTLGICAGVLGLICFIIFPGLIPGIFGQSSGGAAGFMYISLGFFVILSLTGGIFYYINIWKAHAALKKATNNAYPYSPAMAVFLHFVPVFSLIWQIMWTVKLNKFLNDNGKRVSGVYLLVFLNIVTFIGIVLCGISMSTPGMVICSFAGLLIQTTLSYKAAEEVQSLVAG